MSVEKFDPTSVLGTEEGVEEMLELLYLQGQLSILKAHIKDSEERALTIITRKNELEETLKNLKDKPDIKVVKP